MHVPLVIIRETAHGLHQETEATEPDSGEDGDAGIATCGEHATGLIVTLDG